MPSDGKGGLSRTDDPQQRLRRIYCDRDGRKTRMFGEKIAHRLIDRASFVELRTPVGGTERDGDRAVRREACTVSRSHEHMVR